MLVFIAVMAFQFSFVLWIHKSTLCADDVQGIRKVELSFFQGRQPGVETQPVTRIRTQFSERDISLCQRLR